MSTSRRRGVFSLGKYRFPVVGTSTRHLSQLVQPASSSQQQQQQQLLDSSSGGGGSSKAVKYTPCSRQESQLDNDELEEIAVVSVSGVESGQLTYGTAGTSMVNGPRVVPGQFVLHHFHLISTSFRRIPSAGILPEQAVYLPFICVLRFYNPRRIAKDNATTATVRLDAQSQVGCLLNMHT